MKDTRKSNLRAIFVWVTSAMLVLQLLGVDASRALAQAATETTEGVAALTGGTQENGQDAEDQPMSLAAFEHEVELDGMWVRVSAAEGTLPADARLDVVAPEGEEATRAAGYVAAVRPEGSEPETSETMVVRVLSAEGEELKVTDGKKATVTIGREGLLADGREARVYEILDDAARLLDQRVEEDAVAVEVELSATLVLEVAPAEEGEPTEGEPTESAEPEEGEDQVDPVSDATSVVEETADDAQEAQDEADEAKANEEKTESDAAVEKDEAKQSNTSTLGTQSTSTLQPQGTVSTNYIDEDGNQQTAQWCTDFSDVVDREGAQLEAGWYRVSSSRTFSNRLTVTGRANLILCDDATLTLNKGIRITQRYSPRLIIWCQEGRTGKLVAVGDSDQAGIGGDDGEIGGSIEIHGGIVEATGGDEAAGIGGGNEADCGTVEILGGTVIAKASGSYGAGIGGGDQGAGGTVTISQSTEENGVETKVEATGADYAAGIGSGDEADGDSGTITISGGTVIANGGKEGAGIGSGNECDGGVGTITISGGTVTATGGELAAGIGGGDDVSNGVTKILGGNVTANGGYGAAGIGGGEDGHGGTIEISGGTVRAHGEATMIGPSIYSGAGIGGGEHGNGGTITISGGSVTAVGSDQCAGIGGGHIGHGETVEISGGTVNARGGNDGAGIGGSVNGDGGTVRISGNANVTVRGGKHAAAIGGGAAAKSKGANVSIECAATVTAFVNSDGMSGTQAIGHGKYGTDEGSLYLGDGERVFHNKNAPSASGAVDTYVGQAYDACRSYYVRIEPCTHPELSAGSAQWLSETAHTYNCIRCTHSRIYAEGPHVFDDDGDCLCGAQKINFVYSENGGENRTKTVTEIYNRAKHSDQMYSIETNPWDRPHYDLKSWLCEGNGESCEVTPGGRMGYLELEKYLEPGGGAYTLNLKAQWQQRYGSIRISNIVKSPVASERNLAFKYRIRLEGTAGQSYNGTASGHKFENGLSEVIYVDSQPVTVYGLPEGLDYTVIQEGPSGSSLTADDFLTKGSHVYGTTSSRVSDTTFTNTRRQGSLALSVGVRSPLQADAGKGFPVTVRYTGSGSGSFDDTYGDLEFKQGVAQLTLTDGQTALATDLPSGTYKIEWGTDDDFTREPSAGSEEVTIEGGGYDGKPAPLVEASATYARKVGELEVQKVVQGGTSSDAEQPFSLTVTLNDPSINGTFGEGDSAVTFADGVATFSLKDGESRVAAGLPQGVGYAVEEAPVAGFATTKAGDAGTIGEARSTATFTSARQTGDLEVSLAVKSSTAADKTRAFPVVVELSDATVSGWHGGMLFSDGVATVALCDGESKTAEGLPAGVGYEVSQAEVPGFTFTASGTEGTIDTQKARAILTNVRAEGGLLVSASVASPIASERDRSFPVTVRLTDLDSLNGTYGEMTFKNGKATFTLGNGESRLAEGLPQDTAYTVTTEAGEQFEGVVDPAGGTLSATELGRVSIAYTRRTGDVTVTNKVVQGSNSDNQRPFSYTMELSDRSLSGTFGDLEFADGVATFTLSHQQSKAAAGLPTGVVCTVRQERLAGFAADGLAQTAAATSDGETLAFTNTRQTGSLAVTNAVTGGTGTAFRFTVRLSDTSVRGTYGDMSFDNAGAASFTLGNGESKTASGLPAGVGYTVEQEPAEGYVTTGSGATGSIGTAGSTAAFGNTYAACGLVVTNQVVSDVPGDHAASKTFSFRVRVTGADVANQTVGGVRFDEDGVASFSLADGQAQALEDLPAGATYVVSQAADDDFRSGAVDWPSGTVPDAGAATVAWRNVRKTGSLRVTNTVTSALAADASRGFAYTVTLEGAPIDGTYGGLRFVDGTATKTLRGGQAVTADGLPAGVAYTVRQEGDAGFVTTLQGEEGLEATGVVGATGGPVATAAFANARKAGTLTVTNAVRDKQGDTLDGVQFLYTVTLSDKTFSQTLGEGANETTFTNGVAMFGLENGQRQIEGLPQGMGYTVSQQSALGFEKQAAGESGSIGGSPATAAFTNTQLQQSAVLKVTKVVSGAGYSGGEQFMFRVSKRDAAIGDIMPDVCTATAMAGETASFRPITFLQPGTYYYAISEVSPATPFANMGYDTGTYWARVVVTRSDEAGSTLEASVTYGPSKAEATHESLTITNAYAHPPLTVSFESNGGSAVEAQSVEYGDAAERPADPTRTGHTFKGWCADEGLSTIYSFKSKVVQDLTLYAKWSADSYTVAFEPNGGSAVEAQTVEYGNKAERPGDPTREGHAFKGWCADEGLTKPYDFDADVTANVTLYAKWQAKTYTVTFKSNGGSAVAAQKVNYDSVAKKPANPTRTGYTFKGWYTDSKCTKAYDFNTVVTANVTLYAKWQTKTYTVTFKSNGGSAVAAQKVNYGSVVKAPKAPTRYGHNFLGWYTDAKLTKAYNFSTKVKKNVTLYARWRAHVPSVKYRTHVQTYGWQKYVKDGAMGGTSGQSKRLEGINIKVSNLPYKGSIQYRTHVQSYGWQGWKKDGQMSGTQGESKRLEAIQIRLTGELAKHYDVYYRVHCQTYGWLGWAKNGEKSGSAGYSKRLEAIQIVLVAKGSKAPGSIVKGIEQCVSQRYISEYGDK